MTSHSVPQDALVKSQKIHRTLLRVRALPVFGIVLLILAAFMPFEASMKNSDWLPVPAVPFSGSPYTGSAISLPGRIEVENFDLGGEGVAYHDTTATNDGGYYRAEGVDVCSCGSPYGLSVGWTQAGEWM